LANRMKVANYYLQGDLVSRIGSHFGPTFELLPSARKPKYKVRPDGPNEDLEDLLRIHSLAAFQEVVHERKGAPLREAKLARPPADAAINSLTSVSWILASLNLEIHEYRQLWNVRWIREKLDSVEDGSALDPVRLLSYRYLYNVGITELKRLREEGHPDKAHDA